MRTTRDSFTDSKNRKLVIHQLGTPPVDADMNEGQKIGAVDEAETTNAILAGSIRATDVASSLRPVYAAGTGFRPYASGTAKIFLTKGSCWIEGFRVTLDSDLDLTAAGLSFPVVGGSDIYGYIYADVTWAEVDSAGDASIAVPQLGETARRIAMSITYHKAESTVSYAAAVSGIAALPVVTDPRIWKGNTARVFFCKYYRAAASTNINSGDVLDLRHPVSGENRQTFIKTLRPSGSASGSSDEGSGEADSMIVWNLDNSKLVIGKRTDNANPEDHMTGLYVKSAEGPKHYVASNPGQVWASTGAGTTDGSPVVLVPGDGWALAEDQALGWLTQQGAAGGSGRLAKDTVAGSWVFDQTPAPTSPTFGPFFTEKLSVAALTSFNKDPGSFILCYRKGPDLIWYNGQVTRGYAGTPSFEELGATPSVYTAIVGTTGNANHLAYQDGVERALAIPMTGQGDGAVGASKTLRYHVRRGSWIFTRKIRKFGTIGSGGTTYSYLNTKSNIIVEGDGPSVTELYFQNTVSASRAAADPAILVMAADRIELRELRLRQNQDATYKGSYFYFEGYEVVLENCIFSGPVAIKAAKVRIKNCIFEGFGGSAVRNFVADSTGNPLVAQHLYLSTLADSTQHEWEVDHNVFLMTSDAGTHAGVVVEPDRATSPLTLDMHHNHFVYTATCTIPSVHINGKYGKLDIYKNQFLNARGKGKPGYIAPADGTAPFNGSSYGGSVLIKDVSNNQTVAAAYVSCTKGRDPSSAIEVHHNYFDMTYLGQTASAFTAWGCFIHAFNSITAAATTRIHNVHFDDNEVNMSCSNGYGWPGSPTTKVCAWGFVLMPTYQDGVGLSALRVYNVTGNGNSFDLGGEDAANQKWIWRSILGVDVDTWPADSVGHFMDTPCLLGVSMRASTGASAYTNTNRRATGVVFNNNRIYTRALDGSSEAQRAIISLNDSVMNDYWLSFICVEQGHYSTNRTAATETGAPLRMFTGVKAPVAMGNTIEAPVYTRAGTMTGDVGAVYFGGCYQARGSNNFIELYCIAGGSPIRIPGIFDDGGIRSLFVGNNEACGYAVGGGSSGYCISNLLVHGLAEGPNGNFGSTTKQALETASTGHNFVA